MENLNLIIRKKNEENDRMMNTIMELNNELERLKSESNN